MPRKFQRVEEQLYVLVPHTGKKMIIQKQTKTLRLSILATKEEAILATMKYVGKLQMK